MIKKYNCFQTSANILMSLEFYIVYILQYDLIKKTILWNIILNLLPFFFQSIIVQSK